GGGRVRRVGCGGGRGGVVGLVGVLRHLPQQRREVLAHAPRAEALVHRLAHFARQFVDVVHHLDLLLEVLQLLAVQAVGVRGGSGLADAVGQQQLGGTDAALLGLGQERLGDGQEVLLGEAVGNDLAQFGDLAGGGVGWGGGGFLWPAALWRRAPC